MRALGAAMVLSLVLALTCSPALAGPDDVAMVVDLEGGPAVYDSGEKQGREVALMDFLAQGDRIRLEAGTRLTLNYFASGRREDITGPGVIVAEVKGSRQEKGAALTGSRVAYLPPKSAVKEADLQHVGAVVLRDVGEKKKRVVLLSPFKTAVRSPRPVFCWRPVAGAEAYRVQVLDLMDQTLLDVTTARTEMAYPRADLTRGLKYRWIVTALAQGQSLAKGQGRFFLLSEEEAQKVSQAEEAIKSGYPEGTTASLVTLALMYQNHELNDEAAEVYRQLHQRYPDNENITRQLKSVDPNFR